MGNKKPAEAGYVKRLIIFGRDSGMAADIDTAVVAAVAVPDMDLLSRVHPYMDLNFRGLNSCYRCYCLATI